jgi:hypothetical protein
MTLSEVMSGVDEGMVKGPRSGDDRCRKIRGGEVAAGSESYGRPAGTSTIDAARSQWEDSRQAKEAAMTECRHQNQPGVDSAWRRLADA